MSNDDAEHGTADDGASRQPPRAAPAPAGGPTRRRPRWGFIGLGVVMLLGAAGGIAWWYANRDLLATDDAFTNGRAVSIAPRISGNVVALDVTDNQRVHAGQRLLRIDPRDYTAARDEAQGSLRAVQAELASAQANLGVQLVTQPARLASAKAALAAAQANGVRAARDYARFHAIDPQATTRQDIDTATASNRQATAQVAQAQAQVAEADTVPLAVAQAEARIKQLEAQVQQAKARLAQADLNLGYTVLLAPQDGWITQRFVESGNYVQAGATIFTIVTPEVWVTANFKENALKRMRPGQAVSIRVDAYPALRLEGHVDSIQLGSGSRFSAFPAENATGNFVKIVQRVPVKIVIDRGLDADRPLPLGISVVPTVTVR